jgi:hypothetical protein
LWDFDFVAWLELWVWLLAFEHWPDRHRNPFSAANDKDLAGSTEGPKTSAISDR